MAANRYHAPPHGPTVYRRRGSIGDGWVTYTEEQSHYPMARWVQECLRESGGAVALRAFGMPMQLASVRAGAGRGILPCFIADEDPLLERITPLLPEIAAEYWVIVHRDLRRAACVRAVMDWVRRLFVDHRDALAGARVVPPPMLAAG